MPRGRHKRAFSRVFLYTMAKRDTKIRKKESIYFLLPTRIRLALEDEARETGTTMCWVVRAAIRSFRQQRRKMPRFRRPGRLEEKHVRFCLKLYGEKSELVNYARANGGEFSPFVRHVLELWFRGDLSLDLESSRTTKSVYSFLTKFDGIASIKRIFKFYYKKDDYWPKNPAGNLWLMELGLARRKHPLVL